MEVNQDYIKTSVKKVKTKEIIDTGIDNSNGNRILCSVSTGVNGLKKSYFYEKPGIRRNYLGKKTLEKMGIREDFSTLLKDVESV